jgi:preprotein translocase subunit SecF
VRRKEKQARDTNNKIMPEQIVDASIKETFARQLGTTLTTMVPVVALCCLPVPLIREFAIPIMFGLIAGAFSSVFIATSLYVRFEKYRNKSQRPQKLQRQDNLVSAE